MANKTLQTRISLKIDTWANWNTAAGKAHVLKRGEIAFVQIGNDIPPITGGTAATEAPEGLIKNPNAVLYKVGDGVTTFENLKWGSAIAADVYDWAKAASVAYDTTTQKIEFKDAAGNKIGNGIDLSTLASDADLTALETRLTELINNGGTANSELKKRVDAIEADYTTAAQAGSIAQGKADAVLGTENDGATVKTVYGVAKAVEEAASTAAANLSDAVNTLKGTKASDDTTAETIRGAKDYADAKIAALVDGAPEALDTLDELAAALKDNKDIVTVLEQSIGNKADKALFEQHVTSKGNPHEVTAAQVGAYTTGQADDKFAAKADLTGGNITVKEATNAVNATNATNATNAIKATQDAKGNVIDETYATVKALSTHETKENNPHKVTAAQVGAYTTGDADAKFAQLSAFETDKATVKKATYAATAGSATTATSAATATKATQDGNGRVIADTYALQSEHNAHVTSKENPHEVTAAQVGAYTTGEADAKFATLTAFESNKTTVKEATHATNADNATNATTATKATQDGNGDVIADTYETKSDANQFKARVKAIEDDYLTEADFFYIDGGRAPTA